MNNNKIEDIGIYTNIHESGNKANDGHRLYYATCKLCNTTVEKTLSDIKRNNTRCCHKNGYYQQETRKVNDMPRGWINQSKLNERIYYMWKAMLERTTEKFWEKYPTYTGTTVTDEWRYLSNFVNDIRDLDGYDKWISAGKNEMMLDKDTIVNGNKHYSKETCRFISHTESNQDVFNRHPDNLKKAKETLMDNGSIPVRFINVKTNETLDFKSLKDGCRELDLNFFNAWAVVSEKYPDRHTIKDWKIVKI